MAEASRRSQERSPQQNLRQYDVYSLSNTHAPHMSLRYRGQGRAQNAPQSLLGVTRFPTGAEVKDAGFATHFLPSSRLGELTDRLVGLGPRAGDHSAVDALLRDMEREQHERGQVQGQGQAVDNSGGEVWGGGGSGLLEWKLPLINAHFGKGSVAEVVASLEAAVTAGGQGQGQGEAARAFLADTLAAMRK